MSILTILRNIAASFASSRHSFAALIVIKLKYCSIGVVFGNFEVLVDRNN